MGDDIARLLEVVAALGEGKFDDRAPDQNLFIEWVPVSVVRKARELSKMRPEPMWQPIETAPKDGTPVLCALYYNNDRSYWGQLVICWDDHNHIWTDGVGWEQNLIDEPTETPLFWMPLPDPPTSTPSVGEKPVA